MWCTEPLGVVFTLSFGALLPSHQSFCFCGEGNENNKQSALGFESGLLLTLTKQLYTYSHTGQWIHHGCQMFTSHLGSLQLLLNGRQWFLYMRWGWGDRRIQTGENLNFSLSLALAAPRGQLPAWLYINTIPSVYTDEIGDSLPGSHLSKLHRTIQTNDSSPHVNRNW